MDRNGTSVSETITPTKNQSDRYVLGVLLASDFTFPFDVSISLDNVGGPSAGMMFALGGIVDNLTPGGTLLAANTWRAPARSPPMAPWAPIGGALPKR